jgi:DNA-binding MarR family transcriptional regulator
MRAGIAPAARPAIGEVVPANSGYRKPNSGVYGRFRSRQLVNLVDYIVNTGDYRSITMDAGNQNTSKENSREPLGRYLIRLFSFFERELFDEIHRSPEFADIGAADHRILRCLGGEGRSISEISRLTGTTKQAVSRAVASLEMRGFVRKTGDSEDGRAQIVEFTRKGLRLFKKGMSVVGGIEKKYQRLLGRKELDLVKQRLALLIQSYEAKGE